MPKILLVEDEIRMAENLKQVFTIKGYEVVLATTGKDAIELYQKENPDVVLLDLGLPDINGRDVLKDIKAKRPELKVIIVSGYADTNVQEELTKLGADYFLSKPVMPSKLYGVLNEVFNKPK
jgi:DNA-binding response OmpR family regulator